VDRRAVEHQLFLAGLAAGFLAFAPAAPFRAVAAAIRAVMMPMLARAGVMIPVVAPGALAARGAGGRPRAAFPPASRAGAASPPAATGSIEAALAAIARRIARVATVAVAIHSVAIALTVCRALPRQARGVSRVTISFHKSSIPSPFAAETGSGGVFSFRVFFA